MYLTPVLTLGPLVGGAREAAPFIEDDLNRTSWNCVYVSTLHSLDIQVGLLGSCGCLDKRDTLLIGFYNSLSKQ